MSLQDLTLDTDVQEVKSDVLPGAGYTLDTGMYDMIIDVAYMDTSDKGALAMKLHLKTADTEGKTLRTAFWVRSGTGKGNNTHYVTAKGVKRPLPGYTQASQVSFIACGKALKDLNEEEKFIKLWNNAAQAEENTKIRYLPELQNKPIMVGVLKIRDNKVVLNNGEYVKTAEERFTNEVDKLFFPNGISVTEQNAGITTPEFRNRWVALYGTKTVNRYEKTENSQPDLPHIAEGTPVSSLFSKQD